MITLIIFLPLIGSLFFLDLKEEALAIAEHPQLQEKKNISVNQIGLSTSLIVFLLTFYLFISKTILVDVIDPDFSQIDFNILTRDHASISFLYEAFLDRF